MLHDILNKTYSDIELEQIQNGVVSYFITTDDGYVKIGKSTYKSLPSRLSSLQTGNHRILELIGILDGVKYSEDSLHKLFEKDRVRGEWFIYSEEMTQYLNGIKTSQLIKSTDSDDMVSLPIKLNRLATILYSNVLLEEVSVEDLNDLINNTPHKKVRHEKASFTDLANYLKERLKVSNIDQIDWNKYSSREDWIDLLKQHYKLYGKVLTYYTKTKNMVEAATKEQDQIKIEVQSKFLVTNTYSRKEIKEYLGKLYKQYDLKRPPSHQDMYNWFNIKDKIIQGSYVMQILSHK